MGLLFINGVIVWLPCNDKMQGMLLFPASLLPYFYVQEQLLRYFWGP